MMAVDMPLNVPMKRNGTPNVNNTSQKIWVRAKNLSENILHNMIM